MKAWTSIIVFAASAAVFVTGANAAPSRSHAQPRTGIVHHRISSSPIQHVVVIIQENRTVDDLFNGFCVNASICANTVTADPVTGTPLVPESLAAPFGLNHDHPTFVTQFDNGAMDGFPLTPVNCQVKGCTNTAFNYAPMAETLVYRQIATRDGLLADATFEPQQGPSLPGHFYAIAGQSGGYDSDQLAIAGGAGNCATKTGVPQIEMNSAYPGVMGPREPPCKDFTTIFDLLTTAGYSWRYYSDAPGGWWSPTEGIKHLYGSPNFIVPSTQVLSDIQSGQLANVSYVIPFNGSVSDHPEHVKDPQAGPNWVGSIVNAIGETPYWNSTVVVIFWDDWGGFFDHVAPPASPLNPDPFEYGFRVPMIVVSPYATLGTIDHTPRTFVSTLNFIEETFGLPSLHTLDQYEPGIDAMLNFNQPPNPYRVVGGPSTRPFVVRPKPDPSLGIGDGDD